MAAAGGAVSSVASTSFAVLFIASLVYARSWPRSWRQLTGDERLILFCFGLYVFSAVLAYYNVGDEHNYVKQLGKYARFLLIIPIYLLLSRASLNLFPYLLAGAIVSGPLYLGTALLSLAESPGSPAKGGYHHITFGDMAMLGALFLSTLLVAMEAGKVMKTALVISIICLLYASVLSQARGAWLALPFCLILLLSVAVRHRKIKIQTILLALVVLVAVIAFSPAKDILSNRLQSAVNEIELFQSGEDRASSVGDRLAMWRIAISVWKQHPVVGTGPGDFDEEMQASQAQGLYKSVIVHTSVHNIFLQALATTGAIGFVIICLALFVLPFRLFYMNRVKRGELNIASLSGMVTLTAFAVFGLTESWILRSPVVIVYLLYFVVLATAASKNEKTSWQLSVGSLQ